MCNWLCNYTVCSKNGKLSKEGFYIEFKSAPQKIPSKVDTSANHIAANINEQLQLIGALKVFPLKVYVYHYLQKGKYLGMSESLTKIFLSLAAATFRAGRREQLHQKSQAEKALSGRSVGARHSVRHDYVEAKTTLREASTSLKLAATCARTVVFLKKSRWIYTAGQEWVRLKIGFFNRLGPPPPVPCAEIHFLPKQP